MSFLGLQGPLPDSFLSTFRSPQVCFTWKIQGLVVPSVRDIGNDYFLFLEVAVHVFKDQAKK